MSGKYSSKHNLKCSIQSSLLAVEAIAIRRGAANKRGGMMSQGQARQDGPIKAATRASFGCLARTAAAGWRLGGEIELRRSAPSGAPQEPPSHEQ
ncbi:hypothetical protein VTI28DRAFT_1269 [Corynascus sepedonium]